MANYFFMLYSLRMKAVFPRLGLSFIFLLCCSSLLVAQGQTFSGPKTIGTGGTYTTLVEAVNQLNTGVVTGNVVFSIKPGTYAGRVSILPLVKTSPNWTITFQAENGNPESVIITAAGGTNDTSGYVIQLKGTSNVTLKNLTIVNTGLSFATGVHLFYGANNDSVVGCFIKVDSTQRSGTANVYGVFASGSLGNVNNTNFTNIVNNTIIGGNDGVRFVGAALRDKKNNIIGNTITAFYNDGILMLNNDTIIISRNVLLGEVARRGSTSHFGINVESCDGDFVVSDNYMRNIAYRGMRFHNVVGKTAALVYNNIIAGGFYPTGSSAVGIYITNGSNTQTTKTHNLHIYHNSIYFDQVPTSSEGPYVIEVEGGAPNQTAPTEARTIVIENNIFYASKGAKVARYYGPSNQAPHSDYNNLYTTGPNIGDWTIEGTNSISMDPFFVSSSDLHVLNQNMDNLGTPISFVTKDFDGENRSPVTPDIGADEFGPRIVDLVMVSAAPPVVKLGANQVSFTVKSIGIRSLADSTVSFSYSSNGGTTWSTPEQFKLTGLTGFNMFQTFAFTQPMQITTGGTYQLCVRVNTPGLVSDVDHSNEQICLTVCTGSPGGVFTVGGVTPDFITINAALASLPACGIAGPIVFNIRPGVYPETIYLKEINGASALNTITVQSETGNPEDVVITSSTSRATVNFVSARYFKLRNVTVVNTNAAFWETYSIQLKTNNKRPNDYNLIEGCRILIDSTGNYPSGSIPYRAGVACVDSSSSGSIYEATVAYHTTIANNYIAGGREGIVMRGQSASNFDKGNIIINNIISKSDDKGMDLTNQDSMIIRGNTIRMRDNTDGTGISAHDMSNFDISSNYLTNVGNCGISLWDGSSNSLVVNNMIAGGFKASSNGIGQRGIDLYNCRDTKFFFNSVHIDNSTGATSLPSSAFLSRQGANGHNIVKNNIFYHSAGGYAVYSETGAGIEESDYNNFYTTGNNLAFWNGNQATLDDLKSASTLDDHSISVDPLFTSPTDLHTFNAQLDGKGIYLPEVSNDIDGDQRNVTTPDIGADEFSTFPDIAILTVEPSVAKLGDNTVTVTLLNKGTRSLKDSIVSISYSTDSGKTWTASQTVTIQGLQTTLATEKVSFTQPWNITQGGTRTLCARITPPGLPSDNNKTNESVCTPVCVGFAGGVFTVGGAAPDFPTIVAAVASFGNNPCGIGGPLVFNIRSGTYSERVSIPKYTGASPAATITFQSETGNPKDVIITSAGGHSLSDHHTVQLRGASFVTLRNLTVVNTSDTNATAIHLTSGSHDNRIVGCIIRMDSVSDSASTAGILSSAFTNMFSAAESASGTTIDSSTIIGGNYGIRFLGGSVTNHDSGNVIRNNILRAANAVGIATENNDIKEITANTVTMRGTNDESIGISVLNATSDYSIAANRVLNAGKTGLRLTNADGISRALVANNMIGGGFKELDSNAAFSVSNCDSVHIYYNSVNFDAPSFDGRTFFLTGGSNISIVNNIFSNPGGSTAYYVRTPDAVVRSDYNDYFTKGTDLAYWDGPVTSVAELRFANNMDTNSLAVDPKFFTATNLHTANKSLEGKATQLAEVTVDFDGETRGGSTHPDIGADEFAPDAISVRESLVPKNALWLGQNYPNPFAQSSVVSYQLSVGVAQGMFEICDMLGRIVKRMSIDNSRSQIVLDGSTFSPGMYHYSIVTSYGRVSKSMIVAP